MQVRWVLLALAVVASSSVAQGSETYQCGSCAFTISDEGVLSRTGECNYDCYNLLLSYRGIRVIAEGAFSNMSSLYELSLTNNEISSISDGAFTGLGNLSYLDLSSNKLSALPSLAGLSAL
eukprot:747527-Hanusia_phi.AAC.1